MPAIDKSVGRGEETSVPARALVPVTPDNANDMTYLSRAIYVTVGGTLCLTDAEGNTNTISLPDNFLLPVRAARIWATGTTATGIFSLY